MTFVSKMKGTRIRRRYLTTTVLCTYSLIFNCINEKYSIDTVCSIVVCTYVRVYEYVFTV